MFCWVPKNLAYEEIYLVMAQQLQDLQARRRGLQADAAQVAAVVVATAGGGRHGSGGHGRRRLRSRTRERGPSGAPLGRGRG